MPINNWRQARILVTGANGFVGTNLIRRLSRFPLHLITTDLTGPIDYACDLTSQTATQRLFDQTEPEVVFHLAAKVGGIFANVSKPVDFYLVNTLVNTNVLAEVQRRDVKQVFAMGAGCAYPKRLEDQILSEVDFFDGPPEVTNASYAYAKRNLLVHLQALAENPAFHYTYFIPSNIYGPHDNFHPTFSHVVAGLIQRFTQAKHRSFPSVDIWGNGTSQRDLLFVDDLIDAIIHICDTTPDAGPINIATGHQTSTLALAQAIIHQINYHGQINYDRSFPTGQEQRRFNLARLNQLGWRPNHTLEQGLAATIAWYEQQPELAPAGAL